VKEVLYKFETPIHGNRRSIPIVIKADRNWVERFIPITEFETLFGGYITWQPTEQIGETLGVWGKRNVSRFRRILEERGADFLVVNGEGPEQHPWVLTTQSYEKRHT
jgi:hypothetical protein